MKKSISPRITLSNEVTFFSGSSFYWFRVGLLKSPQITTLGRVIEKCRLSRMSQSLVLAAPCLSSVLHTSTQSFPHQPQYSVSPWGFHKNVGVTEGRGWRPGVENITESHKDNECRELHGAWKWWRTRKAKVSVNKTPRMNMAILSLPPPQGFVFLEDKVSFSFPLFPAFSKHFCLSFMDLLATRAAIYTADIIPISPIMELKI